MRLGALVVIIGFMAAGCSGSGEPSGPTDIQWPQLQEFQLHIQGVAMGASGMAATEEQGGGGTNWVRVASSGDDVLQRAENLAASKPETLNVQAELDAVVAAAKKFQEACKSRAGAAIESSHKELSAAIEQLRSAANL